MGSLAKKHGLQNCACFNVRKSARVLTQHYDTMMQPVGIRATQFTILAVLSTTQGISVTDLSNFLMMDRTTLTRNLRPLETQGLVNTQPGDDKRTRLIKLSKKGKNKLEKAIPLWKQAQKQVTEYMGNNRFNDFLTELNYVEKIPSV